MKVFHLMKNKERLLQRYNIYLSKESLSKFDRVLIIIILNSKTNYVFALRIFWF